MNFFKAKSKSPQELVRQTRDAIVSVEKDPANKKANEKAIEEISKNLRTMKFILYGDGVGILPSLSRKSLSGLFECYTLSLLHACSPSLLL